MLVLSINSLTSQHYLMQTLLGPLRWGKVSFFCHAWGCCIVLTQPLHVCVWQGTPWLLLSHSSSWAASLCCSLTTRTRFKKAWPSCLTFLSEHILLSSNITCSYCKTSQLVTSTQFQPVDLCCFSGLRMVEKHGGTNDTERQDTESFSHPSLVGTELEITVIHVLNVIKSQGFSFMQLERWGNW